MKKILLSAIFMALTITSFGQKKPLDHSVYDNWKSVNGFSMAEDGKFTMFSVNAQEGDGYLVIHNILTGEQKSIPRASSQKFTADGKFIAVVIKPKFDETKAAKIKKVKPDMMPKDSLGIYNTLTKDLKKFPFLKGYKMGKYAKDFLAFQTTPPADTAKSKKPVKKDKDEGSDLILYQFSTSKLDTLKFVSDYDFSKGGDTLFFATRPNAKDTIHKAGLFLYIPKTKAITKVYGYNLKQSVKLPVVSEDNNTLVFYAKLDTTKKKDKIISVLQYKPGFPEARVIIDSTVSGLQKGWQISENRSLEFNKAGTRLFFGISKILPEKDTTLFDADQSKLDIWHYAESYIQPMQLVNLQRELKKTYLSKIELNGDKKIVQLANDDYESLQVAGDWSADWAYSASDDNYKIESQWSANPHRDLYIVDVNTAGSKAILKDVYISNVSSSPDAKFLTWYNNADNQWYSYEVSTGNIQNITKEIGVSFTDELNDSPAMASSYGNGGWSEGDKWIYIYDRYDIWQIDPKGIAPAVNLTDGIGRKENKTFRLFRPYEDMMMSRFRSEAPEPFKLNEVLYFTAFDNVTKNNGYYVLDMSKKKPLLQKLVLEQFTFANFTKTKKLPVIVYVKSNFTNSPDVWITKDNFKTQTKITDINPQQRDYNWGTSELVKWKAANGTELEGLLFKPEDFDASKKYPMIVYFYERNSDLLNVYRAPAPSRSTINITYFASNGYVVFIPDIVYEIGHPGESAIDCIIPGVRKICENSWADSTNVAIQGQSWGGYQVAYMVTRPEAFKWKAAEAGAPVSNMTSAYGGIRWGTGMVRQFQYEHTQSRIGKTLWDGLDLYLENSPLFFADKVETPLLIMHNDADDAVPWYQGIEYFTALRRLGKPAWMLQYNKETHNLTSRVNAKDLSIRLSQFFDHFLKGAPMPVWMKTGVPATLKGIDWGYELIKE
ncbi:MAG TPA: prolyl oligopeptidase family serine peptidase [Bacteroidales bacterium]|nr:prolyl oligopeptidase family serine peptidase [Bacteroidales bacterium]